MERAGDRRRWAVTNVTSTGHTTGTVKFWVDQAKFTVAQFLMASLPGPFTMGSKLQPAKRVPGVLALKAWKRRTRLGQEVNMVARRAAHWRGPGVIEGGRVMDQTHIQQNGATHLARRPC